MFISVIIPTRNRFDYVTLLIEDLKHQDITNFEIIVVDQSDAPKEIKDCKHIITDSKGPCISRNIGAKHAKGDILVFLDDDARIYNNFLKEITTLIINKQFKIIAGSICNPKGDIITKVPLLKLNTANFIHAITTNPNTETSRVTWAFPAGCAAILTSVFHDVGGFNEKFDPTGAGEDRDMALKLYKHGYAIWYNAKAKLLHAEAPLGGTRDNGSRSLMLDVHSYWMCKEYFSEELSNAFKDTIIKKYRKALYQAVLSGHLVNTKYKLLKQVKKLMQ